MNDGRNNMNNMKRRPNGMNNGGHRHQQNRPRRFNNNNNGRSSMDDSANVARTRRNATQSREKYQMLARDAMGMGDRVLAENYLQHADHYHRVLLALPPEEVRQPRPNHQPGEHDRQQSPEQQDGSSTDNSNNHEEPIALTTHALPSFITQPHATVQSDDMNDQPSSMSEE